MHRYENKFLVVNWVALKRAVLFEETKVCRLLRWLLGLLGQKHGLDVWQHTTLSDGDAGEQLVQLFVVTDSQLQVTGDDSGFLVVAGCVTCQLENLSGQVFHDGGQVHGGSGTDALGVVAFAQQTVDTTDWELKSGAG